MKSKTLDRYNFPGSSRVTDGTYDSETKRVHLSFPDGVEWIYERVPKSVWKQFKAAGSAGAFVADVLNNYPNHRG